MVMQSELLCVSVLYYAYEHLPHKFRIVLQLYGFGVAVRYIVGFF